MQRRHRQRSRAAWARSFLNSLSLSLFLWLFGVIVFAFATYAFISIRTTSRQWTESVHEGAQQFSSLIKRSTHYEMLLNRKEDVGVTIKAIAEEPAVKGVRIYDKNGVIIFSAKEEEIGHAVDMQAEACVICHDKSQPLRSVPSGGRVRVFDAPEDGRILGLISPIENAPECSSAACHAHPAEQTVLGVLDVKMSLASADARLEMMRRQLMVASAFTALLVGVAAAVFIFRMVRRPVRALMEATESVAAGDLTTELSLERRDEIGQLARSFNKMTGDLKQAREELTAWSGRLEQSLLAKTTELSKTQRQVVLMERMASLGKLAATVAHEINNPLAGILNYAKLVERTLRESTAVHPEEEAEELGRYINLIQKETARCGNTVRNLLLFTRQSGAEFILVPLNPIIERSLMIVRHHLEMAGIDLETGFLEGDDAIVCDGDQVQQALVAILMNAIEAMTEGGALTVKAERVDDCVQVSVRDTGVGIPPEVVPHIFEPFFSTKEDQNGVGLGLSVAYGIMQRHGGRIEVDSEVGRGTTFTLVLPRRPKTEGGAKTHRSV
ncbi:MAG: HAMP domain-containing protein [Deltaproteobacteria bacterium]|nr:HAMP domain-containing protein [Deltaproteobacteria bacterium]